MDITTTLLAVILSIVLVMIGRWCIRRNQRHQLFRQYGIRGPKPYLFAGNYYQLNAIEHNRNKVITKWMQQYGDVFGFYLGEDPFLVIKDLDILKDVMIKDFQSFTNRPNMFSEVHPLDKALIFMEGKRWKEVRSILSPTFSSSKMRLMTDTVTKKIDIVLSIVSEKAEKKEMFDIYEILQGLTLDVIAACAFALNSNCIQNTKDPFLLAARHFIRFAGDNRLVELTIMFPWISKIAALVSKYISAGKMADLVLDHVKYAIRERKNNPDRHRVDLLQLILDHREGEGRDSEIKLSDEEIMANAYMMILAGYETTSTSLGFTFYLLVTNPEIQERLHDEIEEVCNADYDTIQNLKYLDQVFNESLRILPPITGFFSRRCDKDYPAGSFTIPKGVEVVSPTWDIHHDPELWPEPWKFDPDRFSAANKSNIKPLAFQPFGAGPRNCVGARFAQLEAKFAIFKLLEKFRFEICEKTDHPITLQCPVFATQPAKGVWVRAVPRT